MRRLAVAAAVLLAAAAILGYAAARVAVSTPAFEARLRARVVAALAARLDGVEVGEVRVDPLFRVAIAPLRASVRGGAATFSVEKARVRPSLLALLSGRAEPASIGLSGLRLARPAALGPVDAALHLSRDGADDRVTARVWLPGGGRADVTAERDGGGWRARIEAREVGPEALPEALRGEAARIDGGALALAVDGRLAPGLARAEVDVRLSAAGLSIAGTRIGAEPVGPLSAAFAGRIAWDGAARHLSVRDATVTLLGRVPVAVAADLRDGPGLPFSLSLRGDGVDYRALVEALPPSLAPPAAAPRPPGTLDARLDVAGPLRDPAAWTLAAALDLARLREAARRAAPVPLRAPFVHHPPESPATSIVVGPASPDFVPIAELPEHVVRAVTTSEDGGFFGHSGFDFDELRNALAQGAEAGRVVRGGSTITQQLAKNLFLSTEKTLARKVREAVITVGLEAAVPKRRLLEIYLNVVEWGPGLHGIGPAARHWFGKDARELTPREAAFLASVIPNPVRYHFMYDRGFPSEAWDARVNDLLFKMAGQGVLTDDQLSEGLVAPLWFSGG